MLKCHELNIEYIFLYLKYIFQTVLFFIITEPVYKICLVF